MRNELTDSRKPGVRKVPIAIIGGGFSGAVLAWHLRKKGVTADVAVIEPHADIGRGLAYATPDPAHRINVPATRMIIDSDDPEHFHRWLIATDYLATDRKAAMPDGRLFPTRETFGRYMAGQVRGLSPTITHLRAKAASASATETGFHIICDNGTTLDATIMVLAICHAPPAVPASLSALQAHPRFFPDPWSADLLPSLSPDDRILIVGTGLTMADVLASLERTGHRGKIIAISRRGLRPQPHTDDQSVFERDFTSPPTTQATALCRAIRRAVIEAAHEGLPWQIVLNRVHEQGQPIWQNLSPLARRRFLRHLRPYWDTHRFRIAPQVQKAIERRIASSMLDVRAASVRANMTTADTITVDLRPRHDAQWSPATFDAVILATGPAHAFAANPLLSSMTTSGLLQPDTLGLGIAVDRLGRAIDHRNEPNPRLFVASPLARGTFGELMGVSDLSAYAENIAERIAVSWQAARHDARPASERTC